MSDAFAKAFAIVIGEECGYCNDVADPGGATKYGISHAAYPDLDIASLTLADAQAIYRRDYWDKISGDRLDPRLALLVFDAAVNNGVGRAGMLSLLYQAPFTLHDLIIKSIEREIFNALNGKKAEIIAKMNSLMDNQVIRTLYKASQAGVKINLIIRGACALRPQIAGLSDNIHVRSIVGRFLEHHRIFYFYNAGSEDVYISSADWMKRNFFKRVETCVPILNLKVKKRVIDEGLKLYLQDNTESWAMQSDGTYIRINDRKRRKISAQTTLINKLAKPAENLTVSMPGLVVGNAVKVIQDEEHLIQHDTRVEKINHQPIEKKKTASHTKVKKEEN